MDTGEGMYYGECCEVCKPGDSQTCTPGDTNTLYVYKKIKNKKQNKQKKNLSKMYIIIQINSYLYHEFQQTYFIFCNKFSFLFLFFTAFSVSLCYVSYHFFLNFLIIL